MSPATARGTRTSAGIHEPGRASAVQVGGRMSRTWQMVVEGDATTMTTDAIPVFDRKPGAKHIVIFSADGALPGSILQVHVAPTPSGAWVQVGHHKVTPKANTVEVSVPPYIGDADGPNVSYLKGVFAAHRPVDHGKVAMAQVARLRPGEKHPSPFADVPAYNVNLTLDYHTEENAQ